MTGKVLVVGDALEKDTDGDGLKDWEEGLWGTDINNPDSDGDGSSDYDEIRQIQQYIKEEGGDPNDLKNDTTRTGALTRDILTIAKAVNQNGILTAESQEAITDEIAKYIAQRENTIYTITDITIMNTATTAQNKAYAYLIKKSVEERAPVSQTDIELITNYEKNIDASIVAPYLQTAQKFKKERDFIKKTLVPDKYITIHLEYLNTLEQLYSLFADLGQHEEDPAKALSALLSAQTVLENYQKLLELMSQ